MTASDVQYLCPICECTSGFKKVDSRGEFDIMQCPRCELKFGWPLYYDLEQYEDFYKRSSDDGHIGFRARTISREAMKAKANKIIPLIDRFALRWLKNHVPANSRVIDIGCGAGWFLAALEDSGYDPAGLEVVEQQVNSLSQKGFPMIKAEVENYPSDWPQPAAVTSFEVLEHVTRPVEFLAKIRRRFPNAPIVLSVPSPKRWNLRTGGHEDTDFPPNHLTRWNEKSLTEALTRAGYANISFEYPRATSTELLWWFYLGFLKRIGAEGHVAFIGNNSGGGGFFKALRMLRTPVVWTYDASVQWFLPLLFSPIIGAFRVLRWPGYPMLAVALPADGEREAE